MRTVVIVLAVVLASCTAPPPAGTSAAIPELAGRTAGPAQKCITIQRSEGLQIAGPHTLLYRSGPTIWVNAVPECSRLRSSDILVLEPFGSQYCRGDFVRTRDNQTGIPGPGCRLGDFVPYTRG